MNARGDELGPGGRIIRKAEDVVREGRARSSTNQAADADDQSGGV